MWWKPEQSLEALSPRQLWKRRAGFYQYFDRVKSAAERWGVVLSGRCDVVPFIDRVAAGPGLVVRLASAGTALASGRGLAAWWLIWWRGIRLAGFPAAARSRSRRRFNGFTVAGDVSICAVFPR